MRVYTLAHAAYFEACIAGHPKGFCHWLAEQIPPVQEFQKNSLEWSMLSTKAMPEFLPDHCYGCGHYFDELIPGGNVRLVCPNCVEQDEPEADSKMNWFLDMQITLIDLDPHSYFPELLEYLLAVHALWIATEKYKLGEINWTRKAPVSAASSLMEKLKANSYARKQSGV